MYLDSVKQTCKVVVKCACMTKHLSIMTIDASDVTSMFMTGRARLVGVTAALVSEKFLNKDVNFRYPCQKGVVICRPSNGVFTCAKCPKAYKKAISMQVWSVLWKISLIFKPICHL